MSKAQPGNITKLEVFDETPTDKAERLKHEQELKSSQSYIDEQVKLAVSEFPDMVSSEERNKKLKEQKAEKEKKRWKQFHFMGKD